tara:strand:+ start:247 stop:840 length:594 start_codon:yes stop_codon:yes gene_type:complete
LRGHPPFNVVGWQYEQQCFSPFGDDCQLFLSEIFEKNKHQPSFGKKSVFLDLCPLFGNNKPMRPSWEQYALNIACAVAERSEDIYQKVGACALNDKNMVIAVGYNGLASGKDVSHAFLRNRNHRRPFMIHAEVNCLSLVKRGEVKMLACTLLPCSSCAAMIAAYGVEKVVFKEIYNRDKSGLEIFKFYGIECIQYGD